MKTLDLQDLDELSSVAQTSTRLRQHRNIHSSFEEPCQKLLNAIEPGSYIRPHRHLTDPKAEMLIAIRGRMLLLTFNDDGSVKAKVKFGFFKGGEGVSIVEIPAAQWHTVIALDRGSILLEVKSGPFNPNAPKDMAPWAPKEGLFEARAYLEALVEREV